MVEGKVSNGFNFKAWDFYSLCQTEQNLLQSWL